MADETLDIRVDDNGSTTVVTNNLQKLAAAAEGVATSVERTNESVGDSAGGFNAAGDAAGKAAGAVRGYVDANGNYIRQVGSNASATATARTATDALRSSLSATSIEQGRAAAGYGALNAATTSSASSSAAFNASVRGLNTELGTYGTATTGAAGASSALAGAAAGAAGAVGGGAGAANAAAGANARAGDAADNHSKKVQGVKASYGAFNETMQDAIRRLGLLAVAFVGVRAADFVTQADNVRSGLNIITAGATETAAVMQTLGGIQKSLGIDLSSLFAAYRSGSSAFASLRQGVGNLPNLIQQVSNAARVSADSTGNYQTAAAELFGTLKGGVATQETLSLLQSRYPNLLSLITQGYSKMTTGATDSVGASDRLTAAMANGQLPISKLVVLFNELVPTINKAANSAGSTLPVAFNKAYQGLVNYIQTNQAAITATYALSGALVALSNAPGAVVAGLAAIAAAIAVIGLASLTAALGVLGGALVTAGGAFVAATAAVTGLTVAGAGILLTVAGLTAGFVGFVGLLATNVGSINNLANAWGGYNTIVGTVLKNIALIGLAYQKLGEFLVAGVKQIGDWIAKGAEWASQFDLIRVGIDAVSAAYNKMRDLISGVMPSVTSAATVATSAITATVQAADSALNQASAQAAAAGSSTGGIISDLAAKGQELAKSFTSIPSVVTDTTLAINAGNGAMSQMISLDEQGNAAKTQFAQSTAVATGRSNEFQQALARMNAAAGITTGGLNGLSSAMGNAAAATGTFASAADRLQSQLAGTQAGVGEFSQATINATASMSNLEKSSNSTISALSGVASAFQSASSAASGYASAAAQAAYETNTVKGNIGQSSGGPFDVSGYALMQAGYGNSLSGLSPQELVRANLNKLGKQYAANPYNTMVRDQYNSVAENYNTVNPNAQVALLPTPDSRAEDAAKAAEATKAATQSATANTTAVAANTSALRASTAASTSVASILPDLLTAGNDNTVTTSNGLTGVGASVTQVTTQAPPRVMAPSAYDADFGGGGPSQDVVQKMNGGFDPGPSVPGVINMVMNIKSDDYGQFKQSQRMIAQDAANRIMMAAS
jgi:hypothetical protein